jgi:hypothetical protein
MLISAVTVEDGIVRVWRDWLKRQSKKDRHDTTTHIQQDEDDVLWVNNKKAVGLKLRVREKKWKRPMLPVLMHRDEEGAVSYEVEIEGMSFLHIVLLLLQHELTWLKS